MLKGSPGTALRLKVEKLLTGEQADVTLRRERIKISGIPYYGMIADGVGYILHDDFTEECSLDMRRALVELKKQGATSLIIDLRGNGGGILQEAVKILSLLVPKGTEVVSMKGRIGELDETFTTQTDPIDTRMPVVVLVNSRPRLPRSSRARCKIWTAPYCSASGPSARDSCNRPARSATMPF